MSFAKQTRRKRIVQITSALSLLLCAQFGVSSVARAACPSTELVNCGSNCSWGYNAVSDTYFPKTNTIAVAQAASDATHACTSTLIEVQGTVQITAAGYADYFFEFEVESGGTVLFDGNSDVSHDQKPVAPKKCQISPPSCSLFILNGNGFNGVDDYVIVP